MDQVDELFDLVRAVARDGRVGAHAAGVRSRVAFVDALEILNGRQRRRARTVAQREHGDLLALEQLLDHDRVAERLGGTQRRVELLLVAADENPFARRQPVGLDHAGGAGHRQRFRVRDAGRAHHILGEGLRSFDPRRLRTRAEDGHSEMSQLVGDPADEGRLWADDDEIGLERAGEAE